ncbi:MAG: homoserine O-succinyltransferase [Gammaproteobacteria bacterium]|nr:homoserine O-succinyltransferase [Gammaproteobacteria bacterium]
MHGISTRRGEIRVGQPFTLKRGGSLLSPQIGYELTGPEAAPVLVAMGGISATRHVASTAEYSGPGWWEDFVGPGKALDTSRFRVLGMDFLGGNDQTQGPRLQAGPFPSVDPEDQARLLAELMDLLSIPRLHGFFGASYGGMVALQFAALFPERLEKLVIVGATHRPPAIATALRCVQREAIRRCQRLGDAAEGLRIARAIGMVTYRSAQEFEQRFSAEPESRDGQLAFEVQDYLFSRGDEFARRFSPEAVLCLSESIDLQQMEPERITVPAELLCASTDFVAPPELMIELSRRINAPCRYTQYESLYGHDSFLKEVELLGAHFKRILNT